jgi:hypothetical protein
MTSGSDDLLLVGTGENAIDWLRLGSISTCAYLPWPRQGNWSLES